MSAPDTPPKKQARRHWPLLAGVFLAALFGVGLILFWVMEVVVTAPEPGENGAAEPGPAQIESGDVDVPPEAPVREVEPDIVNPGLGDD